MASIITLTQDQIDELNALTALLTEANDALAAQVTELGTQQTIVDDKDAILRAVHEAIETKAILHLERERKNLVAPGTHVTTPIVEQDLIDSVTDYDDPLYPTPPPGDPALPTEDVNLFGGSGTFAGNEQNQLAIETQNIEDIQTALPIPPNDEEDRRTNAGVATERTNIQNALTAQIAALDEQIAALTAFLADNPVANDHVTTGDLTAASTALTNAQTAKTDAQTFQASLAADPGWSDAALDARQTQIAARTTYITGTRGPAILAQLDTAGTGLWHRRFYWITLRVRLADGTLATSVNFTKAADASNAQITQNQDKITSINALLAAQ